MPKGADLATLIRVLHDHDDGDAQAILNGAFAALPPANAADRRADERAKGAEAMADAYFGFYLLAMGSGRTRSPDEIRAMLKTAGFEQIRTLPMPRPLLASGLVARKPA